ncbi:MAG: Ig-like domain-containing protein [Candidatus Tectomicrobia bacterium]|nr:Ig-like domain-containing protein [Candidatus Tectomicrobia bacterium]
MKSLCVIVAGVALACLLVGCSGGGNDDPTAVGDTASTTPGAPVIIDVTSNDVANDGMIDPTTVMIIAAPSNGAASVSTTTGVVTYTANAGFTGTDILMYTVNDDSGRTSNAATVTLTVTTTSDFINFVQQLLDADANSEPAPVNNLTFQNQLDAGEPIPVAAFLP